MLGGALTGESFGAKVPFPALACAFCFTLTVSNCGYEGLCIEKLLLWWFAGDDGVEVGYKCDEMFGAPPMCGVEGEADIPMLPCETDKLFDGAYAGRFISVG